MTVREQLRAWFVTVVVFVLALWLLSDILLPFIAGIAVAYFLDPVVDRLEARKFNRGWATIAVLVVFFALLVIVLLLLVPVLHNQVLGLISRVPQAIAVARETVLPLAQDVLSRLQLDEQGARDALQGIAKDTADLFLSLLRRALQGGLAVFNLISLALIAPIVAFYMLRDFDLITGKIDTLLPRQHAVTIRRLLGEIDQVLAGFVRGQGTVCLLLGTFYAASLTLVGLDFGLIIGLLSGLISFVPFVGAFVGLLLSVLTALTQFLPTGEYLQIGLVIAIFVGGQALEGNFLTPRLLGDRIGLHPVWVIFALLVGGSLAGFVGVLIALPVAAAAGVLVRFGVEQYMDSRLYRGSAAANDAGDG